MGGGVKAVQQKSKVELLFFPCGFPKLTKPINLGTELVDLSSKLVVGWLLICRWLEAGGGHGPQAGTVWDRQAMGQLYGRQADRQIA